MKQSIIILSTFLLAFFANANAQTKIGIADVNSLPDDEAVLKIMQDSISKERKTLEGLLKKKDFKAKQIALKEEIKKKQADKLSLEKQKANLENEVAGNKAEMEKIALTDSLCAAACYQLLRIKPDRTFFDKKVQPAMKTYDRITTAIVKEQYKNLDELLPNYENYYNEVRNFLLDLCKDTTPWNAKVSKELKDKMYQLPYYKKFYGEKYSFYYLDDQIDRIEKAIDEGERNRLGQILNTWMPMINSSKPAK